MRRPLRHRAVSCLKALATGDAIGKQTETLSHADVLRHYPQTITGFEGEPGTVIPRYASKRYEWRVGETTDDTEQTLAVARAVLQSGRVRHEEIGKELLQCKKSLHPGVSLWNFVQRKDASSVVTTGDGCGAAMRVAPIGIVLAPDRLDRLVEAVYECSIPTHGGQAAICAAAAVAAAISAALDGWPNDKVLATALSAVGLAETLRPSSDSPSISAAIGKIHADLSGRALLDSHEIASCYFPNGPATIVPLAIALALVTRSAEQTILLASNIGGDADSVASIGGAIAGTLYPDTVSKAWFAVVNALNGDGVEEIAIQLARLRPI